MDTSTPTLQGKSSEGVDDKVDEEPTAEPNRIVERRTNPPTVTPKQLSLIPLHYKFRSLRPLSLRIDSAQWDPSFSLPPASDEQVAFLLTNGARLSDYKWIGLYDQCNKKSIPLVWLLEVDPPREEEIGPMIALERNISSGEVRILNCNTILIPSLFYAADRKQPNTFFFIGTGNVTENAQQTKARAIGYELDDPLEQHYGDDVMVRLPRGVRTFDVDFLNIYNEDVKRTDDPLEQHYGDDVMVRLPRGVRTFDVDFLNIYNEDVKRTYGYVILPSLLVPPCADDL
ncbi:hypothetical protein OSTOST_00576 [Ostertagia ostertagi]